MGNVWFTSDLHIGHRNCATKYRGFSTVEEHDQTLKENWIKHVGKRDKVFILGDIGEFKKPQGLEFYKDLPGYKHLIMGNHDNLPTKYYLEVFDKVDGIVKYNNWWLTHAPIHPFELRGRQNVHGHIHGNHIPDKMYFNVNVDVRDMRPVNIDEIVTTFNNELIGG